jgi:hypothetical protein
MINPNPNCEKDCRFTYEGESTTLLGWTPVYDKTGVQRNENPNIRKQTIDCLTCNKRWCFETQYGQTKIEASKYNVD